MTQLEEENASILQEKSDNQNRIRMKATWILRNKIIDKIITKNTNIQENNLN